jgi:uncharacterized protein YyaL (SSP411 family)
MTDRAAKERKPNRLIDEKSPYLRQHAHNPVDWYPWGEEAFCRAAELDRPVFLSIGYSSCHWCHVMEEESFVDDEVAKLLNDHFIAIKVDREERPDIDATYMSAAQLLSGGGGWPLTVFLTPDRKPFFASTYVPKVAKFGRAGLVDLLPSIVSFWKERRKELIDVSNKVLTSLREDDGTSAGGSLGEEVLMKGFQNLMESFDETNGGFGIAPKFPTPHRLTMLLRYWNRTGDPKALWMADRTLEEMRRGGIYDQLGGGFHRYSTDPQWKVPHFEKMLYDQALLAIAYLEGWQATGKEEHARIAREVLDYVLKEMISPEGGFYSAYDADSEGEEGKYFLWTEDEAAAILTAEELNAARRLFGITAGGNISEHGQEGRAGKNVLHLMHDDVDDDPMLGSLRKKLLATRKERVPPGLDDKIMADWNGLMIAAMARGAAVLKEDRYLLAAERAADFVLTKLRSDQGMVHMYRDGPAAVPAFLDDHAFMAWGMLELFQAGQDARWLKEAKAMVTTMNEKFWDEEMGGYFLTAAGSEVQIHRRKDVYDGAVPSGNSLALLDLVLLYRITEEHDLLEKADRTIEAFSGSIFAMPEQFAQFMNAVDFRLGPSYSVVISGVKGAVDTSLFFDELARVFLPNKVVLLKEPSSAGDDIARLSPLVQGQAMKDGRAVAQICTERACLTETADPQAIARLLRPA